MRISHPSPPGMDITRYSDAKILIKTPFVSTPFQLYREKKKKKKGEVPQKSFFNLAENFGASSLWADHHRYTRFLQVCDYLKRYGQNTEILRNSTIV